MDTKEVAARLGTTPKDLRRFLRSKSSTYTAVGSSDRYSFKETDLEELTRRFRKWADTRKTAKAEKIIPAQADGDMSRTADEQVWDEVEAMEAKHGRQAFADLPDIRDPRVRAAVRAKAKEQEARLNELLMARGVHVSQGWVSSAGATR